MHDELVERMMRRWVLAGQVYGLLRVHELLERISGA